MRKRKIIIGVICILIFAIIFGSFLLNHVITETEDQEVSYVQYLKSEHGTTNAVKVDVTSGKDWSSLDRRSVGAQYDGVIYNNTSKDIKNWTVKIDVPEGSYIDSSWNGDFDVQTDVIKVVPVDYNREIPAGGSQTFGMILYTPQYYEADHVTITVQKISRVTDYPLYWLTMFLLVIAIVILVVYAAFELKLYRMRLTQERYKGIIIQSLKTFANAIDAKDEYTKGHSERVASYSKEIAKRLRMSEEEQESIYYIAMLHDIGKIGVSDYILNKPGRLNEDEFRVIKMHPAIGGDILKDFTSIPGISDGARYHHERFDGAGYSIGLRGEDIPLCARIICVADSYDAMTSTRCYREDLSEDYVLQELRSCSGTQFDPRIAACMIAMIEDGFAPIE